MIKYLVDKMFAVYFINKMNKAQLKYGNEFDMRNIGQYIIYIQDLPVPDR